MQRALLYVSSTLLTDLLADGPPRTYSIVANGLPPDARIVAAELDSFCGVLIFTIESATFPDIDAATPIPDLAPTVAKFLLLPVEERT